MPTMIKLGGAEIDQDDPCALYQALYAAKLKLLAGDQIEEIEIRSPVTQRRMRVSKANMQAIDLELSRLMSACEMKRTDRRGRYAKRMRFI